MSVEVFFSALESCQGWRPIDDRIMGGASRSRLRHWPRSG